MPQEAKTAYVADCDSDGEEIHESRSQANTTAKRQSQQQQRRDQPDRARDRDRDPKPAQQSSKPARDAASDSGYSSRTAATGGSADSVQSSRKAAAAAAPPKVKIDTAAKRRSTAGTDVKSAKPPPSPAKPPTRNTSVRGRTAVRSNPTTTVCTDPDCDCEDAPRRPRPRRLSAAPVQRHSAQPDMYANYLPPTPSAMMPPPPRRGSSTSRGRPQSWIQPPEFFAAPGHGPPPSARGWANLPVQSPHPYAATPPNASYIQYAQSPVSPYDTRDPRPSPGPRGYSDSRAYADDLPSARRPAYIASDQASYGPDMRSECTERGPDPRQPAPMAPSSPAKPRPMELPAARELQPPVSARPMAALPAPPVSARALVPAAQALDYYEQSPWDSDEENYYDDYELYEEVNPRKAQANVKKTRPAITHAQTYAGVLPPARGPSPKRDLVRTTSRSTKTTRSDSSVGDAAYSNSGRTKYTTESGSSDRRTSTSDPINKRASLYGYERLAELEQKQIRAKEAVNKEKQRMSSTFTRWQVDAESDAEGHMRAMRGGMPESKITAETLRAAQSRQKHLRAPSDTSSRSKTGSTSSRRSHTISAGDGLKVTVDTESGGITFDFPEDYDGRSIYVRPLDNKMAELTIGDRPNGDRSTVNGSRVDSKFEKIERESRSDERRSDRLDRIESDRRTKKSNTVRRAM